MNQGTQALEFNESEMNLRHQEMGMEARSILKSIQTEHGKLSQAVQVARSDLHYFRARYNYYRLSLTRLEEFERDFIQPTLLRFRDQIMHKEAESIGGKADAVEGQPPFLMPVESQQARSHEAQRPEKRETAAPVPVEIPESAQEVLKDAIAELSLVQVALQAEASQEKNQIMGDSLGRLIRRLKKLD